ncbi:MAG: mRNA surveillance protein pelota [Candidatus Methylarchaceae archaeon HK02M1]|nr:mRNA surveillance protein pelota [Candidatus Methylarchaceae archaeon HK02M1]
MIIHKFIAKKGLAFLTLEDADDLWCLKRIIEPGDLISGETSRVIKRMGTYTRPDKGERVKVKIKLKVERAKLDSSFGRLRIFGKILEMPEDILTKGFHSIVATPNYSLWIQKDRWKEIDLRILKDSEKATERFMIISMDRRDAGVGIVQGTHLQILPTVESGLAGKHYDMKEKSSRPYYKEVIEVIKSVYRPCTEIFVAGPGNTKNSFVNFLSKQKDSFVGHAKIIDGIDITGDDGVHMVLRSAQLRKYIEESKLAHVTALLEQAVKKIADGDDRIAFTFDEVKEASKLGAVDSVLISDKIFEHGIDEDDLAELLNSVEEFRGKGYLIDSSTDTGSQVMGMGGIVAILRFSLRASKV